MEELIKQKEYFNTGLTLGYNFRRFQLHKLKRLIEKNEDKLMKALYEDLGKSPFEAYSTELSLVYGELNYHLKNLKSNMSIHHVKGNLMSFYAKNYFIYEPYGHVMIISPFNYPVQLSLLPLVGAIATGNVITLKLANATKHTNKVLKEIFDEFPDYYLNLLPLDISDDAMDDLLDKYRFDLIMFTGSINVGRKIYQAAAKYLTPVILELGGKSPCFIDEDADLDMAARKIVWGKFINAGQTCIAPDYLLVHEKIRELFIVKLEEEIIKQYSNSPLENNEYPKIISEHAFNRLVGLLDKQDIIFGGEYQKSSLKIAPTLVYIDNVDNDNPLLTEEIFGPILPIQTFSNLNQEIIKLRQEEKPLALYYFGKKKNLKKDILLKTSSGGIVFNDVLLHITNLNLPFGGVGNSGMNHYHGIYSFKAFSHQKSVVDKAKFLDPSIRYAPFIKNFDFIKRFLK